MIEDPKAGRQEKHDWTKCIHENRCKGILEKVNQKQQQSPEETKNSVTTKHQEQKHTTTKTKPAWQQTVGMAVLKQAGDDDGNDKHVWRWGKHPPILPSNTTMAFYRWDLPWLHIFYCLTLRLQINPCYHCFHFTSLPISSPTPADHSTPCPDSTRPLVALGIQINISEHQLPYFCIWVLLLPTQTLTMSAMSITLWNFWAVFFSPEGILNNSNSRKGSTTAVLGMHGWCTGTWRYPRRRSTLENTCLPAKCAEKSWMWASCADSWKYTPHRAGVTEKIEAGEGLSDEQQMFFHTCALYRCSAQASALPTVTSCNRDGMSSPLHRSKHRSCTWSDCHGCGYHEGSWPPVHHNM